MLILAYVLSSLVICKTIAQQLNIDCDSANSCENSTLNCTDGIECIVTIKGHNAAHRAIIYGKNATYLQVYVGGDESGEQLLADADVYCPIDVSCFIYCSSTYNIFSFLESCSNLTIFAENSRDVHIICENQNSACSGLTIFCPYTGSCTLEGTPNTAGITNSHIFSRQGFKTVTVINGDSTTDMGSMTCGYSYTETCIINKLANYNACEGGTHVCDTNSSITFEPTTIQPTTSTPTTFIPTTFAPTSIPTTLIPTTLAPTTTQPTTIEPTTFIPTLNEPTFTNPIPTTANQLITTEADYDNLNQYKVVIQTNNGDKLSVDGWDNIVGDVLESDYDVTIVDVVVDGDTIIVNINSQNELDTDLIENELIAELESAYPDVTVRIEKRNNDSENKNDSFTIMVSIIGGIICCCCCIFLLMCRYRINKDKTVNDTKHTVTNVMMTMNSTISNEDIDQNKIENNKNDYKITGDDVVTSGDNGNMSNDEFVIHGDDESETVGTGTQGAIQTVGNHQKANTETFVVEGHRFTEITEGA